MTGIVDSLEDIELRSRSIQGIGPVDLTPLQTAPPTPGGLSPVSSIGPAEKKESAPLFRPELPFPAKRNAMIDLIACHLESERLSNKSAEMFDQEINQNMADITRLQKEKQEALMKEAQALQSRTTWSTAANVAQYLTGASFLVLGWAIWGVSALAAGLLMASAGVGLVNRVAHDTPFMDKMVSWFAKTDEAQKSLKAKIDMLMISLQIGLGAAGGIVAWQAGAFAAAQASSAETVVEKTAAIVGAGSQIMATGSNVGVQYYNKQMADMQGRMREIQGQITVDQQTIYQDSGAMARIVETVQGETDAIRRALRDLQISID